MRAPSRPGPADLANHRCLAWLSRDQPKAQWSFVSPAGSTETIVVTPVLCADSLVVRQWAVREKASPTKPAWTSRQTFALAGWFDCLRSMKAKPYRSAR
jgi:hypothetical protein